MILYSNGAFPPLLYNLNLSTSYMIYKSMNKSKVFKYISTFLALRRKYFGNYCKTTGVMPVLYFTPAGCKGHYTFVLYFCLIENVRLVSKNRWTQSCTNLGNPSPSVSLHPCIAEQHSWLLPGKIPQAHAGR